MTAQTEVLIDLLNNVEILINKDKTRCKVIIMFRDPMILLQRESNSSGAHEFQCNVWSIAHLKQYAAQN